MNDSDEHSGPGTAEPLPSLPPLDFRAVRRRLFAALIASIVIPFAFCCLYGYYTYERALSETGTGAFSAKSRSRCGAII
ncbi:hypothetical protein [Caballeronia sp. INDeC2]|uniref:hypothetical protein n=1 Tax=Caballeronia sp. INDeC2 TaxID=2921747 RepID=UPI002027E1A6|nr:hypothetical protein [Caballeronia sp. INDeC2]